MKLDAADLWLREHAGQGASIRTLPAAARRPHRRRWSTEDILGVERRLGTILSLMVRARITPRRRAEMMREALRRLAGIARETKARWRVK